MEWEPAGRVVSVNVGRRRAVEWHGRIVESAIWKEPVEGRVAVRGVLVDGDEQADLRVHGGTDKAVYAYALEDYQWWSARLDRALEPGTFGENVTVAGFDPSDAVIGSRWRVGHTVLQVTEPRLPCFKLGMRMGDAAFVDDFAEAGRFGAYLSIVDEGDVGAGDLIAVSPRVDGITVRELGRAERTPDPLLAERVLADPAVPESWQDWARRRLARR
ncbi:MAG TPA: MOSC domain-containing protein [Acidimicrobiia bacterium]|nr:MOSC domain-containing protein [Acidimicrobiia bacterium]